MKLYAQARLGWSPEQAQAFVAGIWEPDAIWQEFMLAVCEPT